MNCCRGNSPEDSLEAAEDSIERTVALGMREGVSVKTIEVSRLAFDLLVLSTKLLGTPLKFSLAYITCYGNITVVTSAEDKV
jgi:hypothetical protein